MVTTIVIIAYLAVLVAKWNYYAKYSRNHK